MQDFQQQLTTDNKQLTTPISSNGLISANELVIEALKNGVDFGRGNPILRLRYFVKLGIIPAPIRIVEQLTAAHKQPPKIVGYYTKETLDTLVKIHNLKEKGHKFGRIKEDLITRKIDQNESQKPQPKIFQKSPVFKQNRQPEIRLSGFSIPRLSLFPSVGISEKDLEKKFRNHEQKLIRLLDGKNLSDVPQITGINFAFVFKGLIIFIAATGLVSVAIISSKNYVSQILSNKEASEKITTSNDLIGQVLAATSDTHRLYIDADTQVSGTTLFAENITAPTVLYGAVAGTGITVSTGQTPTIGVDSSAVVTSVNDLAGTLTITGSGSTSISASGSTITISSTDNNAGGDITAVSAGNGLTGGGTSGDVSLAIALSASGTSSTTSSASGLQFSSGLSLLRGCSNSQTLAWISATSTWDCTAGGGSMTSFTLSGDTGTDQTISDTNTLEVAGGTNGIDTVAGATDTVTINFDATEVGTTTWGSGSSIAWTFNAGATDPVLTFDSNALTLASAATVTATSVTAFNCTDCLDFDDLEDTLDIDATTTINTTATTTTPLSYLADSLTTGTGLLLSADALTTGTALDVSSTSTAGGASGTSYLLNLARSGANSNTAHTAYGLASSVTNTNATSGTNIAGYFAATGATTANYGIYTTASGGTDYGIYSAAGDDIFTLAADEKFYINATATTNTGTAGVLDIDVTTTAQNSRGIDLSFTYSGVSGLSTNPYGIYNSFNFSPVGSGSSGARRAYAQYITFTDTQTGGWNAGNNSFGLAIYGNVTGSGTSVDKNAYGLYSDVLNETDTDVNSRTTYAGYFSARGSTLAANTAYGIY